MKVENCDVVIVGSGVAGLICALSLDKEFKSSFEKTKELRKRYQEAINDKSFVGKELTELQRTYEALEEVTNLSREILRELKIKDRILNHDPETII